MIRPGFRHQGTYTGIKHGCEEGSSLKMCVHFCVRILRLERAWWIKLIGVRDHCFTGVNPYYSLNLWLESWREALSRSFTCFIFLILAKLWGERSHTVFHPHINHNFFRFFSLKVFLCYAPARTWVVYVRRGNWTRKWLVNEQACPEMETNFQEMWCFSSWKKKNKFTLSPSPSIVLFCFCN